MLYECALNAVNSTYCVHLWPTMALITSTECNSYCFLFTMTNISKKQIIASCCSRSLYVAKTKQSNITAMSWIRLSFQVVMLNLFGVQSWAEIQLCSCQLYLILLFCLFIFNSKISQAICNSGWWYVTSWALGVCVHLTACFCLATVKRKKTNKKTKSVTNIASSGNDVGPLRL